MSGTRIASLRYRPLDRPSLQAEDLGPLVAVRGANRSGKSTLARRLCGMERTGPGDVLDLDTETGDGAAPDAGRAAPLLISLSGLDPVNLTGTLARPAAREAVAGVAEAADDPRRLAWLTGIDTVRTALLSHRRAEPAWLPAGLTERGAGPAVTAPARRAELDGQLPPAPSGAPAGPAAPAIEDPVALAARLADLDAAIAHARAHIEGTELPDPAALREVLHSLQELEGSAALDVALPDLGTFLSSARRHFPSLVVSVAGLVLLAALLMALGLSTLAAPLALLAVSAALLVLLAPPLRRDHATAAGMSSLARMLVAEADLQAGAGHDVDAGDDLRRRTLERLALPADLDDAGLAQVRREIEHRLARHAEAQELHEQLRALVAQREDIAARATTAAPPPAPPAPPPPAPADPAAQWAASLDRRRELIRANLAASYLQRARAAEGRIADAVVELDRVRAELLGSFDAAIAEVAARLLTRCSGGRLRALRLDGELQVAGIDGAWHPLRRLARSDAHLVALAVQLARAECLHPDRPLVLDDVLVGLDERNLQAVCTVLANLAEHRQVVVLTSSVAVTDALRRARRSTRVLELR